ncbi:wax ester synthase/diacylglycerol acyltransferase 4-like [Mangifera indica]|uniref:wax ester synthase/diacylglycerol acyltransferase 4-like n=1 Tax=Mangifera indica TaxID=29780 RepID=UPI001CFA196B|nr:wax ester synthase/diacylglycerol acyltransferase 4-like [Mangifera indica]
MEFIMKEPVSPTGQYVSSSALSLSILGVLEFEVPIDDLPVMSLIKDVFLPINPRFSSIMVEDENGEKQWKRVEVELHNHVKIPIFPSGLSLELYDKCFDDYISGIGMEQLPITQPLWEIHIINYPTTTAAAVTIFKLHHSLGNGVSLMGALLSCLQRADNPSLPLTFPSVSLPSNINDYNNNNNNNILNRVYEVFSVIYKTVSDFSWSIIKSTLVEDDKSPIRSGDVGIEFRPMTMATMTFSLDQIRQIKTKLGTTVNDVITGIIFLGTRLYMQEMSEESSKTRSTAVILLNTRVFRGYESIQDMVKPNAKTPWGNYFAFLHVPIPQYVTTDDATPSNPLEFVLKVQQILSAKKNSLAVYLTAQLLKTLKKFRGPEAAARFIHATSKNTSMGISNLMGPVEQIALANHLVKGLYFTVVGTPQSLGITMVSYNGKIRVAVKAEKDFIDISKFKCCLENAFQKIFKVVYEITYASQHVKG